MGLGDWIIMLAPLALIVAAPAVVPWGVRVLFGRWWALGVAIAEVPIVLIGGPWWWFLTLDAECDAPPTIVGNTALDNDSACRAMFFGFPILVVMVCLALLLLSFTIVEVARQRRSKAA